ncbi:unnamed protein product [Musa hybrid cultivar]
MRLEPEAVVVLLDERLRSLEQLVVVDHEHFPSPPPHVLLFHHQRCSLLTVVLLSRLHHLLCDLRRQRLGFTRTSSRRKGGTSPHVSGESAARGRSKENSRDSSASPVLESFQMKKTMNWEMIQRWRRERKKSRKQGSKRSATSVAEATPRRMKLSLPIQWIISYPFLPSPSTSRL